MTEKGESYAGLLEELRAERRRRKSERICNATRRTGLSKSDRDAILKKTGARCHICGGDIVGDWHADHVLANSAGGEHAIDNFLAAHATCNNYRWDYTAKELQEILKLGVWARTQVERRTILGREIAAKFSTHEERRAARTTSGRG